MSQPGKTVVQLLEELETVRARVQELEQSERERASAEGEKSQLEEQMRHAQKMEAIGQIAGGIAHDFNNLLTVIGTGLQMAKLIEDPIKARALLAEAEKACDRGADLVKQLLAFGRKAQVEPRPVDPREVIDEVVGIMRSTFDRRIEIATDLDRALDPVMADPSQIVQVLLNLCVNARDALQMVKKADWPPVLRITVAAKSVVLDERACEGNPEAAPGRFVRIAVSDTGVGMDRETQRRIFEPFFTTKERGKGTGLGLATAYGIVKQHGGWIDVESELGQGTTFQVHLPAIDAAVESEKESAAEELAGGSGVILFADDEEMIRSTTRTMLELLGYSVLVACDGEECLDIFERHRETIDLVILDISMPRLSGFEVMQQILARHPDTKVVLSSGYSETNLGRRYLRKLGASGFVAKPYNPTEFAKTIRQIMNS
jgi:two-component system cell cycle sensor histidine kinase/response regulator CckA